MRVLYSFPHRIGAGRICSTAWYQAATAAKAGVDVRVFAASEARPIPGVEVTETLARGRAKVPYKLVGDQRMFQLHDRIVARWLRKHPGEVDAVHVWPSGALLTLAAARDLGIPSFLERPNAHTRYAYEVVAAECERLGVALPANHEHAYKADVLAREEAEFALADRLLCPSEFVAQTFLDRGFADKQLGRHFYGVDTDVFHPDYPESGRPFTAVFVGAAAVRKGLHFALEAWHRSAAKMYGRFVIAGEILPDYRDLIAPMLDDPTVTALGHCDDVPALVRQADVLLLPSLEEGCALAIGEAMASGCVPLVSKASGALCEDRVSGLLHDVGDVDALAGQLSLVVDDYGMIGGRLDRMRDACIEARPTISWAAAGERLRDVYAA